MCTIAGRDATALLVIDVQVEVVAHAWKRNEIVGRIADLVATARAQDVPVVWVQHSEDELPIGSDGWQLAPELAVAEDEPIVHKLYRSSFEATTLDAELAARNVSHLIICGAETSHCVRHTLHAALERGYDVTLVSDAHTTWDGDYGNPATSAAGIVHEFNLNCRRYSLPGRACDTKTAAEVFD